jgi:glycosyltransferase involved in cell wall biosynthesis
MNPAGFSVLILTYNEERNLPRCLASVAGCDDIVVLDSGSTDRTAELARAAGARVEVRRFDNFANQRNHAQRNIPFRHRWVFHLDADETMTPALISECRATAAAGTEVDGFWVAPRMMFRGRWIPHCTDYPAWQARFVRAPEFEFIEVGHGQRESPRMRLGRLQAAYEHDLSAGGEAEWLEKHRRYARAEAKAFLAGESRPALSGLFSGDRLTRRRALKYHSHALPLRPLLRFFYQYVLRGGFLDGAPGLRYCRLLAQYEGFTAAEIRRLRRENP